MKSQSFELIRYDADEGKVFDWKDLSAHKSIIVNPETGEEEEIQEHLYAKTLFIGSHDSIDNYVEIDAPEQEA